MGLVRQADGRDDEFSDDFIGFQPAELFAAVERDLQGPDADRERCKSEPVEAQIAILPGLVHEHQKAEDVVTELFAYWVTEPEELPEGYFPEIETEGLARVIADYIAGMTDNFILMQFAEVRRRVRATPITVKRSAGANNGELSPVKVRLLR